jgi:hypothetical protein
MPGAAPKESRTSWRGTVMCQMLLAVSAVFSRPDRKLQRLVPLSSRCSEAEYATSLARGNAVARLARMRYSLSLKVK